MTNTELLQKVEEKREYYGITKVTFIDWIGFKSKAKYYEMVTGRRTLPHKHREKFEDFLKMAIEDFVKKYKEVS